MIKKLLKIIILLGMIVALFVSYNAYKTTNDMMQGSENQQILIKYGRKAISMVTEVASPILSLFDINIEGQYSEDTDAITRRVEDAKSSLEQAINSFKK